MKAKIHNWKNKGTWNNYCNLSRSYPSQHILSSTNLILESEPVLASNIKSWKERESWVNGSSSDWTNYFFHGISCLDLHSCLFGLWQRNRKKGIMQSYLNFVLLVTSDCFCCQRKSSTSNVSFILLTEIWVTDARRKSSIINIYSPTDRTIFRQTKERETVRRKQNLKFSIYEAKKLLLQKKGKFVLAFIQEFVYSQPSITSSSSLPSPSRQTNEVSVYKLLGIHRCK